MKTVFLSLLMFINSSLFAGTNNLPPSTENLSVGNLQDTLKQSRMQLKITIGKTTLTASLINNKLTDDFIKLLPLHLTMHDLFGREKFGALPSLFLQQECVLSTIKWVILHIGH